MEGVIKKLFPEKGFGFIKSDDGGEFFFHRSGVSRPGRFDDLEEGQRVEFEEEKSDKGPRAVSVVGL